MLHDWSLARVLPSFERSEREIDDAMAVNVSQQQQDDLCKLRHNLASVTASEQSFLT